MFFVFFFVCNVDGGILIWVFVNVYILFISCEVVRIIIVCIIYGLKSVVGENKNFNISRSYSYLEIKMIVKIWNVLMFIYKI